MSALSDEQKRRIEESRRKALSLRANRAQHKPCDSTNNTVNASYKPTIGPVATVNVPIRAQISSLYNPASTRAKPNHPATVTTNSSYAHTSQSNINSKNTLNSNNTFHNKGKFSNGSANSFYSSKNIKKEPFSQAKFGQRSIGPLPVSPGKTLLGSKSASVTGRCLLESRERFKVEVIYFAPLIALFKTMDSKVYDAVTKKWSFSLGEYHQLFEKLKEMSDTVTIEPLPRCVMLTFDIALRGAPQHQYIPDADLSCVDSCLVSKLLPFQREGVNFAISQNGRVLLADDMGLGKTIQALCVAAYYRKEWPLLIVVPSSVRFAWREQILRWLPSVDAQEINVVVSGKDSCTSGMVNILSYDLMVRRQKELTAKNFRVIIMDESHFLKNNKTARTQTAFPLLKKAARVLLLSGTPALSRPSELFIQLSAINNHLFPRFHDFGLRYCDGKQMQWGWDFTGSSNLAELQLVLEERIMIRRLKKHVLSQLPDKVRQMIVLDPGSVKIGKDMKASHKYVDKAKGSDRRSALLEYFHETGSAKRKAVREYVMDQLESDSKFLVFAHHQEVLDEIEEYVAKKHGYIRIDGRTAAEQRNILCTRFQTQDTIRVAILSICAANAGLNLTAASLVVFAELFWNPGILVQAEDRAHRIGQQDSVSIHYLIATGTADDFVWPLVQNKLDVLGKAGLSKENFTEAHTTHLKDARQRDIMSYFEESFFEDDIVFDDSQTTTDNIVAADNTVAEVAISNTAATTSAHKAKTETQSGLLNYFKPDNATAESRTESALSHGDQRGMTTDEHSVPEMDDDWLDDEMFQDLHDDDDPDAPWPKKPRLN